MPFLEFGFKHWMVEHFPYSDYKLAKTVGATLSNQTPDSEIATFLNSQSTGLIGRLGGTEARYLGALIKNYSNTRELNALHRKFAKLELKKRRLGINRDSGFFFRSPAEELRFLEIYLEALSDCDVLGIWGTAFAWVESIALQNENMKVIPLGSTAPWVNEYPYQDFNAVNSWATALNGKKVLVVSPFAESIKRQHLRIEKCFPGIEYPKFELSLEAPPVTYGFSQNSESSWFDLLQRTLERIQIKNFDVALVGAGAYSLPIAHAIKKMGKIAIHTGGGTQLFFGVMGNRWNDSNYVNHFLNEYWIRPSKSEVPRGHSFVEDSCYW